MERSTRRWDEEEEEKDQEAKAEDEEEEEEARRAWLAVPCRAVPVNRTDELSAPGRGAMSSDRRPAIGRVCMPLSRVHIVRRYFDAATIPEQSQPRYQPDRPPTTRSEKPSPTKREREREREREVVPKVARHRGSCECGLREARGTVNRSSERVAARRGGGRR